MNKLKRISMELMLPILLSWFLMTILVDIFTVPNVFKNVSSLEEAGKVGMAVFSRFNYFEFLFSLLVLTASFNYRKKIYLALSLPLVIWSQIYIYIMTPKIKELTFKIHATAPNNPVLVELWSNHTFYHNLYKYFDSVKLFYLLFFIVLVLKHKTSEETR